MREVEDVLRALKGPEAPRQPPRLSDRRPWAAGMLAAAILLGLLVAGREAPRLRGGPSEAELDLRVTVERGGVAMRTSLEVPLHVGERVFFRVASSEPATAYVWVDTPSGRVEIASVSVDGGSRDVGSAGGLTAYRIDEPGRYAFRVSTEGPGICHGCPTIELEAR
jgi:hypothetical protein